jgi:hypothetical protein
MAQASLLGGGGDYRAPALRGRGSASDSSDFLGNSVRGSRGRTSLDRIRAAAIDADGGIVSAALPSRLFMGFSFFAAVLALVTSALALAQQQTITSNPDISAKEKDKARSMAIAIYLSLAFSIVFVLGTGGSFVSDAVNRSRAKTL